MSDVLRDFRGREIREGDIINIRSGSFHVLHIEGRAVLLAGSIPSATTEVVASHDPVTGERIKLGSGRP